ncbi:MAG: hypothetical protein AAFR16_15340 [Pseudomonadota bacterium]
MTAIGLWGGRAGSLGRTETWRAARRIRARAAAGWALAAAVTAGALDGAARADAPRLPLGAGFCEPGPRELTAAPWPSPGLADALRPGPVVAQRFARCADLRAWRANRADQVATYGYVTLADQRVAAAPDPQASPPSAARPPGAPDWIPTASLALPAALAPGRSPAPAADALHDARLLARFRSEPRGPADLRLDFMAEALRPGQRSLLGSVFERRIHLSAALERAAAADAEPKLRVSAAARHGDLLLTRVMIAPYRGGDSLRYLVAALSAQSIADEIVAIEGLTLRRTR